MDLMPLRAYASRQLHDKLDLYDKLFDSFNYKAPISKSDADYLMILVELNMWCGYYNGRMR
jgi:hypothetical protein